ncbi:MAG: tetratricopeptide repeat protein [Fuerstia sp.]|nr:tetratricopeptide repeat protein [Fuerstiella sp.]
MIQSSAIHQEFNSEAPTLTVSRNGRTVMLTFPQLFAIGHRVWLKGDYKTAKEIFKKLCSVNDRGPRAHIFLAHCHVMEGDYAGGSSVLHRALPKDEFGDAASRLHDTFVLWKVGLFVDVKEGLKSLALDYASLPTFSLMLADLLHSSGSESLSEKFLRRAIHNDRPDGGVALSAKSTLQSITQN